MPTLLCILLATIIDGLVSLAGICTFWMRERTVRRAVSILVAFSAGALLSGAFFHLLAESLEELAVDFAFSLVMLGIILFFLIEKFLHWHHCHKEECPIHPVSYLILIGDAVHNFIGPENAIELCKPPVRYGDRPLVAVDRAKGIVRCLRPRA